MGPVSRRRLPLGVGLCLGWTPYRCGNWSYFGGFGWDGRRGRLRSFRLGIHRGGQPVNIAVFPVGYRPIRVPVPGRGPERPLIPVHTSATSRPTARPVQQGARRIAGLTATPIAPLHANSNSGGVATGSSLRRDYPWIPRPTPLSLACRHAAGGRLYRPGIAVLRSSARGSSPATPASRPAPATSYSEPARPAAATPARGRLRRRNGSRRPAFRPSAARLRLPRIPCILLHHRSPGTRHRRPSPLPATATTAPHYSPPPPPSSAPARGPR